MRDLKSHVVISAYLVLHLSSRCVSRFDKNENITAEKGNRKNFFCQIWTFLGTEATLYISFCVVFKLQEVPTAGFFKNYF